MTVRPGAEPFHSDGDDVGVLVLHGFTGNPTSMRPWAEAIAATGRTVALPRLPGHGTTVQDMRSTRWEDWVAEADSAFHTLRAKVSTVVVCGLSMGGALALTLAERYPAEVAGLVLVNPAVRIDDPRLVALPVVKWLTPYLPPVGNDIKKPGVTEDAYGKIPSHALASSLAGYKGVVADLPKVTAPLLLIRSRVDHVVPASSSALILSKVSSPDPVEIVLEDSYHVATLDNDAPTIFEKSIEFIEQVTRNRTTA
ncbi:alpha/beta hydrolase [Spongisporangium articulatum]|uniref:Alpha/beta hydrolase n=1 Tax=Spongisporangium articulatum TaxID=3362603 RepID=A0ABW8ASW0_9ACTN